MRLEQDEAIVIRGTEVYLTDGKRNTMILAHCENLLIYAGSGSYRIAAIDYPFREPNFLMIWGPLKITWKAEFWFTATKKLAARVDLLGKE